MIIQLFNEPEEFILWNKLREQIKEVKKHFNNKTEILNINQSEHLKMKYAMNQIKKNWKIESITKRLHCIENRTSGLKDRLSGLEDRVY